MTAIALATMAVAIGIPLGVWLGGKTGEWERRREESPDFKGWWSNR